MKKQHIQLKVSERIYLSELLSKGTQQVRVQKRIMGLQMLDKSMSYKEVSKHLEVSYVTTQNWAKKYKKSGLDFLTDKPRSGRPKVLNGTDRAKVTALACSKPPKGHSQWSLRLLAGRLVSLDLVAGISHTEVGRILKKTNCSHIASDNGVSAS